MLCITIAAYNICITHLTLRKKRAIMIMMEIKKAKENYHGRN